MGMNDARHHVIGHPGPGYFHIRHQVRGVVITGFGEVGF